MLHNLGGKPIGIVGTSFNKIGELSCIYIKLIGFMLFPFTEAAVYMNLLLKHTNATQLSEEHFWCIPLTGRA